MNLSWFIIFIIIIIFLVHIYKKTTEAPRSYCFIGQAWHQMDQIGQYLPQNDKNAYFGPNLAVFGPKKLVFMGGSKNFWYSPIGKTT